MININNTIIKLAGLTVACTVLAACDPEFDSDVNDTSFYSEGSVDLSNFVTIGDSITAGYADSALYLHGQKNSYPNILADQFAKTGGGSFNQPLVSDNLGGLLFNGAANPDFGNRLVLDATTSSPEPIAGDPTTEVFNSPLIGSTFNNMGVSGAKSFHLGSTGLGNAAGLLTTPATANPHFVRFASAPDTSMIVDAATQQPTFFVLWIGNFDVLSYATGGGTGENQLDNDDPTTYGSEDITDPTAFAAVYSGLVTAMVGAGTNKGLLVNIPDVSTLPYFTTVPHNPVPLDQETADTLNSMLAYGAYNAGVQQILGLGAITQEEADQRTITFSAGEGNAVVIMDESLTDLTVYNPALTSMRQATADDLLVLTTMTKIGSLADPANEQSAWGVGVPLTDSDVLIPDEIEEINTARLAFNASIETLATDNDNLLYIDVAAFMAELNDTGIDYGTGSITSSYGTGGAFSLDGIHPTARGYAVIANIMIEAINTNFNATIPMVDPELYSTIFVK